ncbi:MAG TPA: hypothetical protein VGQ00_02505, partial [Candidatus Norongarragalinales archaeon]|nr:hypothetical protein [Candidatus Norongarragalinales archaeon]
MKELQRDKRPLVQLATSLVFTREKGKTKVLLVDRPSSKSRWPDQIMLGWGGKVDKDATPDETVRGMFARLSRETRRER